MALDTTVALVSVVQARTVLKIVGAGEDSVLEDLINRASALAARWIGRGLISAERAEQYDGDGTPELILNHRPVTAVASVYDDPERDFAAASLVAAADRVVDTKAGILERLDASWTKARKNVKVTYTAGWVAGTTVPHDIQDAVLMMIQHHYKRIYQDGRIGLASETVDDRTFAYSQEAIPAKAKEILNRYRDPLSPGAGVAVLA